MLFRQMFDPASSTYTYLLASRRGGDALIIDPVKEQLDEYLKVLRQLDLHLVYAIDTHVHADHITALGGLRDATQCVTLMGNHAQAECISRQLRDGDLIQVGDIALRALSTPGHTRESFSFVLNPIAPVAVFTGDVLLIRGSGRTDFQNGDPHQSWDSIVNKLFKLPDDTTLYPAHDYKGWTASSIGEEKRWNPRLAGKSEAEYVALMNALDLPNPKMMDTAISANLTCGQLPAQPNRPH